jgi:large subunit ribosomal protein L21
VTLRQRRVPVDVPGLDGGRDLARNGAGNGHHLVAEMTALAGQDREHERGPFFLQPIDSPEAVDYLNSFSQEGNTMDYAVIRTGGKQYRVSPGTVLRVEKLEAEPGAELHFAEVLMTSSGGSVQVGNPTVPGARVAARVLEQGRAKKILVFKKKRRKNYRRRQGHRQYLTTIRVDAIETGAGSHGTQEGTGELA